MTGKQYWREKHDFFAVSNWDQTSRTVNVFCSNDLKSCNHTGRELIAASLIIKTAHLNHVFL